tara:strand:- start:432 stop:593 length:162 start_codon:yes stop_codon:yes gene_type:complete
MAQPPEILESVFFGNDFGNHRVITPHPQRRIWSKLVDKKSNEEEVKNNRDEEE